jgi:TolB protein
MRRESWRRIVVAFLVVFGLLLLPVGLGSVPRRAAAAFPGANGKIAFVRHHYAGNEIYTLNIYTVNVNGSNPTRLTRGERRDPGAPAWSPDGRQIAFSSVRHGDPTSRIYVMNADGSNARRLSRTGQDMNPAWSPDGRKIAFTAFSASTATSAIYVMNADGSDQTRLARTASPPVWSPDGRKIAFSRGDAIYTVNGDGSDMRQLASIGSGPAWSPDGRKIAFSGNDGIHTMNADGSHRRQLTGSPYDGTPQWSPDGRKIAFYGGVNPAQIYVMNADGSHRRQLTSFGDATFAPVWSPDGRKIAFMGHRRIYAMNADGSDLTGLTNPAPTDNTESWDGALSWQTVPSADLALRLAGDTHTVQSGRALTYTITVRDAGPSNAIGVTVSDPLPAQARFVSVRSSQGSCRHPPLRSTGTVTCSLGLQLTGTSWSARLVVKTAATKRTIRNTIHVTSSTPDPDSTNNSATTTTTLY